MSQFLPRPQDAIDRPRDNLTTWIAPTTSTSNEFEISPSGPVPSLLSHSLAGSQIGIIEYVMALRNTLRGSARSCSFLEWIAATSDYAIGKLNGWELLRPSHLPKMV